MEAAGQGRGRGEGYRRLFRCRARRDRRHRQKARPELHQHHGQPRLSACRGRHAGQRQGALGRLCAELKEHAGDRAKIQEVTRDMAGAYSLGGGAKMPQATQSVDSFYVVQLLMRATDPVRCQERRESAKKHKAACPDEVSVAEEEGVAHKASARQEGGARPCEDPSQGGTRLPDGRGAAGRVLMRRQGIGSRGPRAPLLVDDALCRGRDEERGEDSQEGAGGDLELVEEGFD